MIAPLKGRSDRTRAALLQAFVRLIFRDGYEGISVRSIAAEADSARSTFYEHFAGKEDILSASMAYILAALADCVATDDPPPALVMVTEHLWENRRLADAVFSGAPRKIIALSLGEMIEARLHCRFDGRPLLLPYRLAAIHIAEAQLALVENWLRGRAFCMATELAQALHKSSRASAAALLDPSPG